MIEPNGAKNKSDRSSRMMENRLRVPKASEILANQIKQQDYQRRFAGR